jgi:hypothetical protein
MNTTIREFRYEVIFQTMANGGVEVACFANRNEAVSFAERYAKENGEDIGESDNSRRDTCWCEVLDTERFTYDEDGELDDESLSNSVIHVTCSYYTKNF